MNLLKVEPQPLVVVTRNNVTTTLPQIKVNNNTTNNESTGITANGSAGIVNNSRLRIIAEDPHDSGLSCSIFSAHHSENSDEPVHQ